MHSFQISGLDYATFEPLFTLTVDRLHELGAARCVATSAFGFPCRVSLEDAAPGEELMLVSYEHQPAASPYRSSGPIFVRRDSRASRLPAGIVPPYVTRRLMSLRAYNAAHLMVDAAVCDGPDVAERLELMFDDAAVAYIHLHNAKRGCFSCMASRSTG